MGCDIHTRVEILRNVDGKLQWIDSDYYSRNPYYDKTDGYSRKYEVVKICGDRNYQRFATLAGVRNYGNTTPIDKPRGIPKDCNKHIKKDYQKWGCDAHTPSWFTLSELIKYQETNPVSKYSGYISPESAKKLDEENVLPDTWCQGTSDKTWVFREWECKSKVLIPMIDGLKERLKEQLYFVRDDRVLEYADNIRIIFWFDN